MPFGNTVDPAELFNSTAFDEALTTLRLDVERGARLSVLIGAGGVGKTSLLRKLEAEFAATHSTVWVSAPCTSGLQDLIDACSAPSAIDAETGEDDGVTRLRYAAPEDGDGTPKRVLFLIDGAETLSDQTLLSFPDLFSLHDSSQAAIQVVVAGLPVLGQRMKSNPFAVLDAAVDAGCALLPMAEEEVGAYISCQLEHAEYRGKALFSDDAIAAIAEHSQGVPRRVNTLCGMALLVVFDRGLKSVTPEIVNEAVNDLDDLNRDAADSEPRIEEAEGPLSALARGSVPDMIGQLPDSQLGLQAQPEAEPTRRGDAFDDYSRRYIERDRLPAKIGFVASLVVVLLMLVVGLIVMPSTNKDEGLATTQITELQARVEAAENLRREADVRARDIEIEANARYEVLALEQQALRDELARVQAALAATRERPSDKTTADASSSDERVTTELAADTEEASDALETASEPEPRPTEIAIAEAEPKSEASAAVEPEPTTEVIAAVEPEPKSEAVAVVEPEPKSEAVAVVEPEPKSEAVAVVEPEPKSKAVAALESESKSEVVAAALEPEPTSETIATQSAPSDQSEREIRWEPLTPAPVAVASVDETPRITRKRRKARAPTRVRVSPSTLPKVTEPSVATVEPASAAPAKKVLAPETGTFITYSVEPGDSLFSIGEKFDVTIAQLRRWNDLSGDLLRVGQPIKLISNVRSNEGAVDPNAVAALMAAAADGRLSQVEQLLRQGVFVDAQDANGKTALMHAASKNHFAVAGMLLDNDADVNLSSLTGDTALTYAAWHGHLAMLSKLLTHDADVDAVNREGRSALINASINGHAPCVRLLLDKGANLNLQARNGRTALSAAVWNGHDALVRQLLERGADVNVTSNDGWTPLMDAAWNGNAPLVTLLLGHGADPTSKTRSGLTPLEAARQRGHKEVASVLSSQSEDSSES